MYRLRFATLLTFNSIKLEWSIANFASLGLVYGDGLSQKIASLTMVKLKKIIPIKTLKYLEKLWKSTRNHENPWTCLWKSWKLAKIVKNLNIPKHLQWWSSPTNRISCNGNMCPKNIGITSLKKKRPSPSHRKIFLPALKSR